MTDPGTLRARFLVGPTAVGKTAVAQWIAEREGWDILSADSMLVYRGMDIGTDKPGPAARGAVRYLGIDLVTPERPFSAGEYRARVLPELAANARAGRDTLVVGGTGLYVKSLTHGLDSGPGADPARRQQWEELLAREGVERLQSELRTRNPALFESIRDPRNARRLIRALELDEAGLRTAPGGWHAAGGGAPLAGLVRSGADLKRRLAARVEDMYRQGLLDEVRTLLNAPGGLSGAARKAIGYEEAIAVLEGCVSVDEARRRTAARTWQLVRRQMTWFRRQADVRWIEIPDDAATADVARLVLEHWREYGPTTIAV